MQFKVLVFAALRNLNRNKKRSILTMLGIIIGITSVIAIVALGQGYKNKIGYEASFYIAEVGNGTREI